MEELKLMTSHQASLIWLLLDMCWTTWLREILCQEVSCSYERSLLWNSGDSYLRAKSIVLLSVCVNDTRSVWGQEEKGHITETRLWLSICCFIQISLVLNAKSHVSHLTCWYAMFSLNSHQNLSSFYCKLISQKAWPCLCRRSPIGHF